MLTRLAHWSKTGRGVVVACATISTLCASQRLLNRPGASSSPTLSQSWLILLVAFFAYFVVIALMWFVVIRLSDQAAQVILISLFVVLIVGFFVIYPHFGLPANSSGYGDRDDALTLMGKALFSGHNPYQVQTYLGDRVSPLLGAVILSAPATFLVGSAGWMNPVIMAALGWFVVRKLPTPAGLFITLLLVTNVGFIEDYLLGGDVYLYPLVFALACFALFSRSMTISKVLIVALVVIGGLAAASRANTLVVVLAVVLFLLVSGFTSQRRWAIISMGVISVFAGLASMKLAGGLSSWPFAGDVEPRLRIASAVILAFLFLGLAYRWRQGSEAGDVQRLSRTIPWLALSVAPFLLHPLALFRVATGGFPHSDQSCCGNCLD